MVEFIPSDKKVKREIIKHLNELDGKMRDIQTSVSDVNDLQIINKLDIINLKNEIDKIKLLMEQTLPLEKVEEIPEEKPAPKKEKPLELKGYRICPKCSAQFPLKARFCPKCGKKVKT
jgi:ribosomal protein L40E